MRLLSKTYWNGSQIRFRIPPQDVTGTPVRLNAVDGADIRGVFWTPKSNPRPKAVVIAAHPRVDFSTHHTYPAFLKAGYGCLGANLRSVNNDMDCVHEKLLLDIARYMRWLKEDCGVERILLLGNSGGGSLFSFYQSQASTAPKDRIAYTPGGRPTGLVDAEMPEGDALVYMAAHTGQGLIINETIDPAVIDESRPMLTDRSLDMYDPANGFKPAPEWNRYSPEFVQRYRTAQLERVRRLDNLAHEMIAEAQQAEAVHQDAGFNRLDPDMQRQIMRQQAFEPLMIIYRTMANLHYVDNSLDPSPRDYGSLLSERPDLMNFQHRGFARIQTPHAWLSTWSGLSSNANTHLTAPKVTIPSLVIHAGKDLDVFPNTHSRSILESLGAKDKDYWDFPNALHYFEPEQGQNDSASLDALMERLLPWVQERVAA
ncbi:hypothetical protein OS190_13690 [Sulfitobacter sp. F26204]|uniref:alpha/beta hydrolase family protein n=1 Tax=Sulfitobacter sp. F26204 TaxID=2996014 RepID=UPI00225E1EF5|nr:hypothetical protein [Sulfitobacter sp. F26204]MCX7560625.1 hypothetical protein [Sulfitobacter sp. F26204]